MSCDSCGRSCESAVTYFRKGEVATHFCSLQCSLNTGGYKRQKVLAARPSLIEAPGRAYLAGEK